MKRENTGMPSPFLARDMVKAFFESRQAEFVDAGAIIPMSAEVIFQLGTYMDWIVGREAGMVQKADQLDQVYFDSVKKGRAEYKKNPSRLIPPMAWNNQKRTTFVITNLSRQAIVNKGEQTKKGDARDLFHASVGAAYGSFSALDGPWKKRVASLPQPNGIGKIYSKRELARLVEDLEADADRHRRNRI